MHPFLFDDTVDIIDHIRRRMFIPAYEERHIDYDEKVLPLLDDALKDSGEKNFFVLHLMGTHLLYDIRYPAEFAKFTADDEYGDNSEIKKILSEYDNAILYNDYVVNEIIKRFEDKNALVIYLPDHADEVYDERSHVGHFHDGTFWQIEIPMLVYGSPLFCERHEDLWRRIKAAQNRPYMTDDMIHSLLDVMGIVTAEYDPTRSVFGENFDESRPRIYNGMTYNKEHRNTANEVKQ